MHPLAGARAKVERALEHLEEFKTEATAFIGRNPYRVRGKYYAKTCHFTFRFVEDESPPLLRWGVVVGDILHELSSALDHVAWQLALRNPKRSGKTPGRQTAFPVCIEAGQWESKTVQTMLQHISTPHRAFIKGKQPYPTPHGEDPRTHALAMLRLLSRIDKHQVIHTSVVMPLDTDIQLNVTRDVAAVREFVIYDDPVKHGAKLERVFIEPSGPHPRMNMHVNLSMYIAFIGPDYGRMHRGHVFYILRILIREVTRVIDEAEAHL